jgi:hypothetical protein
MLTNFHSKEACIMSIDLAKAPEASNKPERLGISPIDLKPANERRIGLLGKRINPHPQMAARNCHMFSFEREQAVWF